MDVFTTESTSFHSQKVLEPIIIDEKSTTRRVFIAEINDSKTETGETVSGSIIHQRKGLNDEWEDIDSIKLSSLKAGDGVKLRLASDQTKKLYDGLSKLYTLSSRGVIGGINEYIVGKPDELISVPSKRKKYIKKLLDENYEEEIWEELIEKNPDLATKLSHSRIHNNRLKALNKFEESINDESKNESYWQEFFTDNDWIFGYGLNYQFLTIKSDQPSYGGEDYTGKGKQRGDYITKTNSASLKFTVLVEIKKPTSKLLAKNTHSGEDIRYRNGAWLLGREILGGVSQLQINCKSWQEEAENIKNRELMQKSIYTVMPKGILLIGNTKEFCDNHEKLTSFELFRKGLNNIEVLTYDELLKRARFIIGNKED